MDERQITVVLSGPATTIAWELGSGFGHLFPIAAVANELQALGHRVSLSLRDYDSKATRLAIAPNIACRHAPRGDAETPVIRFPTCFAHILLNVGFADFSALSRRIAQWLQIFEQERPTIVVCDHAPTAQLAARCAGVPAARLGIGFCCPPPNDPATRNLRPWRHVSESEVVAAETRVLDNVNQVLLEHKAPCFDRFELLFTSVEETFLMTFRELDHFHCREDPTYCGPAPLPSLKLPMWPAAEGARVLAYLKPFPAMPSVLEFLRRSRRPTLVIGNEIPADVKLQFESDSLQFSNRMIDIPKAVQDCAMTITHATHGVTAASLLAGKPVVMIPIVLEQAILAKRIVETGVGIWAYPHKPNDIVAAIECIARNAVYPCRAMEFAARYKAVCPKKSIARVAAAIDGLARHC